MGHPHPTVEIPGSWPEVLAELDVLMPDEHSTALIDGLNGAAVTHPGHVCATAWVLSPNLDSVLLVEHRILGWSAPGGHLYPGENSLAAARRELAEECGTIATRAEPARERPVFVHITDLVGAGPDQLAHRHWNIAWAFVVHDLSVDADRVDGDEVGTSGDEHAHWWPCDGLPDGPADMTAGLERILLSLRT